LEIYQPYLQQLLDTGQAYYCFCSPQELEAERQAQSGANLTQKYSGKCSSLTQAEVDQLLNEGIKPSIRFRVPEHQLYIVNDLVRGQVSFDSDVSGDFIIAKSDGIPVYNFAVVIDDVLMGITHVIRAEEHLSNTPRQLMLYDAFNFKRPEFAHISLILGNDRQKMSKRHGATSVIQYREMGYLPEALFNFLALLGWSPKSEQEIFDQEEIISYFTLDGVAKSPAVFDMDKLNWINQQYLKKKSEDELVLMLKPYLLASTWKDKAASLSEYQYRLMVQAVRDRLVCLGDFPKEAAVFFQELSFEQAALETLEQPGITQMLEVFRNEMVDFASPEEAKTFMKAFIKKLNLKPKDVYMPLRSALSGQTHGPELPNFLLIWGKQECQRRINQALNIVNGLKN
jgi:nondiscriminating glutamyl-tRNA synthetase